MSPVPGGASPPELADGVELLGQYQDSGFKEPRYLARRPDGQVIQLPPLLYRVAEGLRAGHDYDAIADHVGEAIRRTVSAGDVRFVIDEKLQPLGLVAGADGAPVQTPPKPDALLALKYKSALVPPSVVRVIAATFMPLFFLPVVLAVLGAAIGLDVWLFGIHGLAQGLRGALYEPTTLLLILALVALSALFHECGHAAATRYGGAQPGAMGAGLYLVWPALYTDITDSYRLGRAGRLRADLGGVYFNTIFMLLTAAAYFLTGFEPLLLVIPLQHLEIAHQLLPLLRLDGYYIVSDLTGVPDILSRIKPTLKSLIPGLEPDPRVRELKPWVRAVVTLYLLILVPVLVLLFSMMALAAPRVFATAWDAFGVTWQRAHQAIDRREAVASLVSLIQLAVLGLSPVGLGLTLVRATQRISGAVWRTTEARPRARAVVIAATSATVTALFVNWWTNGAYRPIASDERGTVSSRVFDVHAAIGRQPQHRSTPPRSRDSAKPTEPVRPRVRPGIVPTRSSEEPDVTTGSSAAPGRTRHGTGRGGGTVTAQDPTPGEPFAATPEWDLPPVSTTTDATTTTSTVAAPTTTAPTTTAPTTTVTTSSTTETTTTTP